MTTPLVQMAAKCKEVFAKATELYGVDMSKCAVRFDLKGRAGGMAGARGNPRSYFVRFNADMMLRETNEMVNVVVPHEIAHIVCFMKPELGRNHDYGWARVCRALGGSGDRTHEMDVVYGKGTTYEYMSSTGHAIRVNDRHHQHIQSGRTLTYRKGHGTLSKSCAYSIVGAQGRSFAQPIVKQGAPTKEVPVATFVPTAPTFIIGAPEVPRARPNPFVAPAPRVVQAAPVAAQGMSKAARSRALMRAGYQRGDSYEVVIAAMMVVNGYSRQLARATYLANYAKAGVPAP